MVNWIVTAVFVIIFVTGIQAIYEHETEKAQRTPQKEIQKYEQKINEVGKKRENLKNVSVAKDSLKVKELPKE